MSHHDTSKFTTPRRSTDKSVNNDTFSAVSNTSSSTRVNDISVNTPSPSSVGSSSSVDRSTNDRRSFLWRNHRNKSLISKRRHRSERTFYAATQQCIMAMTNVFFQMHRSIYKLQRRTQRVENILSRQVQCALPVIRIARLTTEELPINTSVNESQPEACHEIDDEHDKTVTAINDEHDTTVTTTENKTTNSDQSKTKFCSVCQHEFSNRSAYVQHKRKMHPEDNQSESLEEHSNATHSDQSAIGSDAESESFQLSVNPWDVGEGRLRPRPVPVGRSGKEPRKKVKCDICNKYYDALNIEKHKLKSHREPSPMRTEQEVTPVIEYLPCVPLPDAVGSLSQLIIPSPNLNESPSALNIADMEHDDIPIQFSTEPTKMLVVATTFIDRQQKIVLDEFLRKFAGSVRPCSSIDRETTHLIVNDEKSSRRSPLTLRFIEAIAHHCYCVSFNWIYECLKYDRLIDETNFEIIGDDTENQTSCGPQRSRLALPDEKLFGKHAFMIKCTENGENTISNDQLRHLIEMSGGTIIDYITQSIRNQYDIIVLCDQLFVSQRRTNYQQCQRLNIRFLSPNWVIRSILEYRLKPFEGFEEVPPTQ